MSFLYLKITQESYNSLAFFVFSKNFRFLTNLMDTPIKKKILLLNRVPMPFVDAAFLKMPVIIISPTKRRSI